MKNTLSSPNKRHFLKIDFYIKCFFFVLISIFGLLSSFSGYFMVLGLFSLLPIMLYNSIGLTCHIFKGSYSKKIELFRKVHAISAIVYLIIFVVVIFGYDNSANTNEITFIIGCSEFAKKILTFVVQTNQSEEIYVQRHNQRHNQR